MIVYEENTKRIVVPSGLGNLTGLMEAEAQAMYNSGRTDGYNEGVEDGKSMQDRKLTDSVTFNENGEYDADYGYKKVIVDVDKQWDEGYESGYTDGYASGYTDGLPKYDYTMRITYPMEKDGSYLLMEMCGMRAPFCLNGKEYPYTFEHYYDPWTQPVNYNYIFIKAEGVNGNGPFISVDMEPYFLDRPVEGGRRYPTPDEMTITFGGVPMTVTAWTMGEYDDEYYGRYYQPYHIECEPLSLDQYEIGFSDGYASGYTNGYASGYTDGQAGYELGTYVSTPMPNDLYGTIYTKSFNDEPHSPDIVGWGALHLDLGQIIYYGKNEQKALMTSGTIVSNGTYTMENGWNKIVVDVPQGESKGALYSIFVSFAGHPTLSSLPTDWKVNGFDFVVTSGYTNISTYTLIGVDGYLDSAISLITPTIITFKVPTTDYEQWSESVSADSCRVNGVITYQTSAYDGGFRQHITGWAGTPDADDPSKTIITINIG